MKNFSFFEVPEADAQNVVKSLNRASHNGRKVVVEVADENGGDEKRGGNRGGGGGRGSYNRDGGNRRSGGNRSEGRGDRNDRPKRDNNSSERGNKASREERGYTQSRGKKDNWQKFFDQSEPDFSEEGWARRQPKKKK